ncbi:hypothetical protein FHS21_001288 [Phyllobacterium trifolii]|uniref:Putative exodeoxyribonuclease 8 PDDEXK-like domain-containing protein n=1 Tax=Phyllobacterium trifolii TaxID=300193 RepID=A0A839U361_9HYPH|nr:PD-(D/E)XK nuclease-like domain-containing protein [Phyllobacterium trifolii]MBB3144887.1 hypothetical protein [Phyllobacterium trifolii]
MEKIIETDAMQSLGSLADKIVGGLAKEKVWDGKPITANGTYAGIKMDDYHNNPNLLDGPSVSKSMLKHLLPTHGGSPKAFFGRWKHNPDHVVPKSSPALEFGKAVHFLLLSEGTFRDHYVIRPDEAPDGRAWNGNNNTCKAWLADRAKEGMTVLTSDQLETIKRMADDASKYPEVQQGILNGRAERSMLWKDPKTGIWLRSRPDVIPAADGVFCDLKSTSSMDEDFLERQIFDCAYYLQAAINRMVCRGLGVPFETFALLYVLNDDVPDTAHVEIETMTIDRGEACVRWCLDTIRHCLDEGYWPGREPFNRGERPIQMKVWSKDRVDHFLNRQAQIAEQEAA